MKAEDYTYSSARNYYTDEQGLIPIVKLSLEWKTV